MSVIEFPGGPKPPCPSDIWDSRTRAHDERYALEVLRARLPAEALRHIAGLELASIACAVLLAVDTARHERRLDPRYDEERTGGELGALERLIAGPPSDEPEPPQSA